MSFRAFAHMVFAVGNATSTHAKLAALAGYFREAPGADQVWTIAIFSGRRPKRLVNSRQLQTWCAGLADIPDWLFEESYHTVGDLAETIALCLPPPADEAVDHTASLADITGQFLALQQQTEEEKKAFVTECWQRFGFEERFVFNKLITGGFRVGISQQMLVKALQQVTGVEASRLAHRISGQWDPATIPLHALLHDEGGAPDASKPYPFYLAYALNDELHTLGHPTAWQAEWKWDGIRGQLIKRSDSLFVWSRGEELMTR